MAGLWDDEFVIPTKKEKTKELVKKAQTKKEVKVQKEKALKSKTVDLSSKLVLITEEVNRILGSYKSNTTILYGREEVSRFIATCIQNGIVAVDTETNNSLDPLSCKLMGVCLYTPGYNQVYIPVNHTDLQGKVLDSQIPIQELAEELNKLKTIACIFHNAKFDYQVIKCTTKVELPITWDTLIGARILDENERAGLKEQYISKIDSTIEKYSIEHLFGKIPYEVVDPDIFALYAATDAYMTYKLYVWQKEQFEKKEHKRLYNLFLTVEMPLVPVIASMELTGMCIDLEYAERLSKKYHKQLDNIDKQIEEELINYYPLIQKFQSSSEGSTIKKGSKSLGEQISVPMNIGSSTQLAILIYDILKFKPISKESPRGTGEEILVKLQKEHPEFILAGLILERRSLVKLINTYIDKLTKCISTVDNRLHANFNQCGAGTGRLSSSDPNLQNIPSKNNEIRMMFVAGEREDIYEIETNSGFCVHSKNSVNTQNGFLLAEDISEGTDILFEDGSSLKVSKIIIENEYIHFQFESE